MTTKKTRKTKKKKAGSQNQYPKAAHESVVRINETEALRFGKLDAEMRNHIQGIKIIELEHADMKRDFNDRLRSKSDEKVALTRAIESVRPEYEELVKTLAKKYKIPDHKKMSIDPDSRAIRDLSGPGDKTK